MTELKACPFCNGEAELAHTTEIRGSVVHCLRCGHRTDVYPVSFNKASDEEAIAAWNRREDA